MKRRLLRPIGRIYGRWMDSWESQLCFRSTDRVVRPFDYGLNWSRHWPVGGEPTAEAYADPVGYIKELNRKAIAQSHQFYGYEVPTDFRREGEWVHFTSPVKTPFPDNNDVKALWFPAEKPKGRAVVLLPHWNSRLPQQNALCAGLAKLGVSVLRLSLPYHDARMPPELSRADYAVSANICRTIDATRQAVIDIRCCFDWLQQQGFTRLGIVGTSLGSCYAFLAAAHDPRIKTCIFNHCSTYFADVVWRGLSTRHIAESLESNISLDELREMWSCISPPYYNALFASHPKKSKFIYTRYDTTFPLDLSEQVIVNAKEHGWHHQFKVLPCGHYTMGESPFKFMVGYEICSFALRNL
jgi:dienelactone hydrolase